MKRTLTQKERQGVLAIIGIGCSRETAARYVQCSPATLSREIKENPAFAAEVTKAVQDSEVFFLSKIRKAAEKEQYWHAAAWALEHRLPNRYGKLKGWSTEQVQELIQSIADILEDALPAKKKRLDVMKQILRLMKS
jgi:hypothetical protein